MFDSGLSVCKTLVLPTGAYQSLSIFPIAGLGEKWFSGEGFRDKRYDWYPVFKAVLQLEIVKV